MRITKKQLEVDKLWEVRDTLLTLKDKLIKRGDSKSLEVVEGLLMGSIYLLSNEQRFKEEEFFTVRTRIETTIKKIQDTLSL